jgi:hypothetical protein
MEFPVQGEERAYYGETRALDILHEFQHPGEIRNPYPNYVDMFGLDDLLRARRVELDYGWRELDPDEEANRSAQSAALERIHRGGGTQSSSPS